MTCLGDRTRGYSTLYVRYLFKMGKMSSGCSEMPLKSLEKLFWTGMDAGSDLNIQYSSKARKLLLEEVVILALPC